MAIPGKLIECSSRVRALLDDPKARVGFEYVAFEISEVASYLPDCNFLFYQETFFPGEPTSKNLFLPHPSFRIINSTVSRFQDQGDVEAAALRQDDYLVLQTKNLIVRSDKNLSRSEKDIIDYVTDLLEEVYQSVVYPHLELNAARKFSRELQKHPSGLSYLTLVQRFKDRFGANVQVHLARKRNEKGNYVVEWASAQDDLNWSKLPAGVSDAVTRALNWNRTTDGFILDDKGEHFHFSVVPTPDAFDSDFTSERGTASLVLSNRNGALDAGSVRYLELAANELGSTIVAAEEKSIIQELLRLRRSLISKSRVGELKTEIQRDEYLQQHLPLLVERIRRISGAHSVTIRTYDPFKEVLSVFCESFTEGGARTTVSHSDISIADETSVNVSCFKTNSVGEYLFSDFVTPSKKALNPRDSKWEYCFSIWKSGVPYGTMNVEGVSHRIVESVLDFLSSVSIHISDLFSEVATLLPSEAISQLATIAYSVHGTLDADPFEFEPLKEGRPVEEQKIVEGWQKYIKNFRTPVSAGYAVDTRLPLADYLPTKILDLFGPWNRDWFNRRVNLFFAEPLTASSAEIANISAILELLVANAGKHSGLGSGAFQLHGLIRGGRPFLFIRYASDDRSVEPAILGAFGSVPIVKDAKVRYGAFLLGEMVRSANGLLYVHQGNRGSSGLHRLQLVIALPLSMEAK